MWEQIAPFILPLAIMGLIARRALRAREPQRIRPSRLWIAPVYVGVAMVLVLATAPRPGVFAVLLFAVGTLAGAGVGYLRALHQEFSIDPQTGYVMSKASPIATLLFVGLFVMRFGLGYLFNGGNQPAHGPQILLYTDTMLFFAFAMLTVSAWEIWRRTRPLVAQHRASKLPGAQNN